MIDPPMPATGRDRNREWLRGIFCSALQGYGSMRCGPPGTGLRICAPLEYDEPDPAPDFDDDECDDDEYGPPARVAEFPGIGHAPALMSQDQIRVVKDFLLADD